MFGKSHTRGKIQTYVYFCRVIHSVFAHIFSLSLSNIQSLVCIFHVRPAEQISYESFSDQWYVWVPKWGESETNNVKLTKKINETAQTANFTDFPLISCGNSPYWTKTMQTQTLFSLLQIFSEVSRECHMKADVRKF